MKTKKLLTLSVGCILALGGLVACSQPAPEEPKYAVTFTNPEHATIGGITSGQQFKKDDLVTFSITVSDTTVYGVDTVKYNGVDAIKSGSNYMFGMPEEDVTLTVTLKDIRQLAFTLSDTTVEIGEDVTYTVTLGGVYDSSVDIAVKTGSVGGVDIDKTNKKVTGTTAGAVTLVASHGDKTVEQTLNVVTSTKMSVNEIYADAVTTNAKKNNNKAGKTYKVYGLVVAKGVVSSAGYCDVIIYDGEEFMEVNAPEASAASVEVGKVYLVSGDVGNYYGLLQLTNNGSQTTPVALTFTEATDKVITAPTPETMTGAQYDAYYDKAATASSKSGTANSLADISIPKFVTVTGTHVNEKNADYVTINGSTHTSLNFSASNDDDRTAVIESLVGCEFNVTGALLGANTFKGYSKMVSTNVTKVAVDVTGVSVSLNSSQLVYGSTVQLTSAVTPAKGATQYGVTYSATPADVITINEDGTITGSVVEQDTDVTITATCNGVTSAPATLTVKAVADGDVVLTSAPTTAEVDKEVSFAGYVYNEPTATLSWDSSDKTVATIDANGKVTTLKEGTTVISATCGTKSSEVTLTVTKRVSPYHAGTQDDPYDTRDCMLVGTNLPADGYTDEVYIRGKIAETGTWSDQYKNFTNGSIVDEKGSFDYYRISYDNDLEAKELFVNDEVLIKGFIQNYKGNTPQISYKGDVSSLIVSKTLGQSTVTVDSKSAAEVEITGLPTTTVANKTDVEFEVALKSEFVDTKEIKSVKVNGDEVTATAGKYSFTVSGDMTVLVEVKNKGEADPTEVKAAYTGETTGNMDGTNQAALLGVNDTNVSIVGTKISGSYNVGLNKEGTIRFYKNGACELAISVNTGKIVKLEIEFGVNKDGIGTLNVNGTDVATAANSTVTVDINAAKAVLKNSHTANQVHIKSVTIYYL